VTSCGVVDCVLSYHIGSIASFTVCYRGDLEIHKQMSVLEGGLWPDWGRDQRLCVCGRGVTGRGGEGVIDTFIKTCRCCIVSSSL
jgi:hypothetical protein